MKKSKFKVGDVVLYGKGNPDWGICDVVYIGVYEESKNPRIHVRFRDNGEVLQFLERYLTILTPLELALF